MKVFDYIYYRTYCWYRVKNDPNHHLMGILIVSLLISMLLFSLFTMLTLFFFPMPNIIKWQSLVVLTIIFILVKYRYNNLVNFGNLNNKWGNESKKDKYKRGWSFILLLVFSIAFPILIGYLKHNVGLNI